MIFPATSIRLGDFPWTCQAYVQLRELALLAKEAAVGLGIDEPRALAPQQHTAGELSIAMVDYQR